MNPKNTNIFIEPKELIKVFEWWWSSAPEWCW
jgi:hypothetical protein